ncbi:retinol dehydrogenase 14-like [Ornithodoros turicata]|uniref:retinol dehydrogenase 14-like n=1 Tax=Ornithodoros turicata TaxID=34597 RepID=UPI003139D716
MPDPSSPTGAGSSPGLRSRRTALANAAAFAMVILSGYLAATARNHKHWSRMVEGQPTVGFVQRLVVTLNRFQHPALLATGSAMVVLLMIRLVNKMSHGNSWRDDSDDQNMLGQTVIVTGANAGIGFETARDLARRRARVILACRCRSKGEEAAQIIRQETNNAAVVFRHLDVSSLRSVQTFAKEILASESRLDVLINNAGITSPKGRRLTKEGLEVTMATNYLGPFLLTNLLLELLQQSSPSRVINVTSSLYHLGRLDLQDLNSERSYGGVEVTYATSKQSLNLFTVELARRLRGTGVTSNAVHPGIVATEFNSKEHDFRHFLWNAFLHIFGKTPQEGARTSTYLATSPEVQDVTGKYFVGCQEVTLSQKSRDPDVAVRLWNKTEALVQRTLSSLEVEETRVLEVVASVRNMGV